MKSIAQIARYVFAQFTEDEFVHVSLQSYPEEKIINFQMTMKNATELRDGIDRAIKWSQNQTSQQGARSEVCRDILGMLEMSDKGTILNKNDLLTEIVFARRDCHGFSGNQLLMLHEHFSDWIDGISFHEDLSCRIRVKTPTSKDCS